MESIKVVERMLTQEAERNIAARKAEAHEKRMGAAFEQLQILAPVVVNKLAGQNLLPSGADAHPAVETLRQVLSSFSTEQLAKLQTSGIFSPAQAIAIFELWESFRKEAEARKKKPTAEEAKP
jgi:hypothetical protein